MVIRGEESQLCSQVPYLPQSPPSAATAASILGLGLAFQSESSGKKASVPPTHLNLIHTQESCQWYRSSSGYCAVRGAALGLQPTREKEEGEKTHRDPADAQAKHSVCSLRLSFLQPANSQPLDQPLTDLLLMNPLVNIYIYIYSPPPPPCCLT